MNLRIQGGSCSQVSTSRISASKADTWSKACALGQEPTSRLGVPRMGNREGARLLEQGPSLQQGKPMTPTSVWGTAFRELLFTGQPQF